MSSCIVLLQVKVRDVVRFISLKSMKKATNMTLLVGCFFIKLFRTLYIFSSTITSLIMLIRYLTALLLRFAKKDLQVNSTEVLLLQLVFSGDCKLFERKDETHYYLIDLVDENDDFE